MKKRLLQDFSEKEVQEKIASIRAKLAQLQEYKDVISASGLKPDAEDKARESFLIVQLRQLEKKQQGLWLPNDKFRKPKSAVGKK